MDPNYAMAKFGLQSKDIIASKHRGCWYYAKYFFFFLSIIQFLIILGLVLFMFYGNAHVATELRLKSLENRYTDLEANYSSVTKNVNQLKPKVASLEKANTNCTNVLSTTRTALNNRLRPVPPPSTSCESTQKAIDLRNTTYIIETLQLNHKKLILQGEYDRFKQRCEQTSAFLTGNVNVAISEVEKLQEGKDDLETKIKTLQLVCSNINARFQKELGHMTSRLEGIFSGPELSSKCWSINTQIERTINVLQVYVRDVISENSQLKTDNARAAENVHKCSQEKVVITSERNELSTEKEKLQKDLFGVKENLSKRYTLYMKKEEELQNCRKMQIGGRLPGVFIPRT